MALLEPQTVDELLTLASENKATDLHISVGSRPRYRKDGNITEMKEYTIITPAIMTRMINPIMDAYAKTILNSTGQYDMSYSVPKVARYRVNIFRQKGDLAAVFRVLPDTIPDYTKLGLPTSIFNVYKKRRGLILIVGPTGSGKTTTLASFLDVINKNTYKHIITLEEPIEYVHWHARSLINQREIGTDCDTFANGLRAALREDPDVILVGEMRDLETTSIAVTSAETGHLVCSTLHTLGASETISRIIDMYPVTQQAQIRSQLTSILEAVVSQQLMPKIGGGYVVAYEIMYKNKRIKELIRDNNIDAINEYLTTNEAIQEGMCSMDQTILQLYHKGKITRQTALDFAFDVKEMSYKV